MREYSETEALVAEAEEWRWEVTTNIIYVNERMVRIERPDLHGNFLCVREDVCRRHEGVWDSRVLAFVPQRQEKFSDGTPVASYEQFN